MVIYLIVLLFSGIICLKYTYIRDNIKAPFTNIPLYIGKINNKPQCIKINS